MSKKLADLEKDKRRNISADVDTATAVLGVDCIHTEGPNQLSRNRLVNFGLCAVLVFVLTANISGMLLVSTGFAEPTVIS
ncbi:MAG: hypothetical protein ACXABY_23865 [Candidatus Thorarchaeota archaeon]|jgi:hypothetical protein